MREEWMIQIKSCIWHNLHKGDFTSHTITVVLWDLWTSVSQDKMIYNMKTKHTKLCSVNYSMSISLSLTQHECTLGEFSEKWFFVTEQALCFSDNRYAQTN